MTNVARLWWWYHEYVEYRIPSSLGTPRAASMRAASAAAASASGASEAPFCKACRNMEKLGKQNGDAHLRVPPCTWVRKAPAQEEARMRYTCEQVSILTLATTYCGVFLLEEIIEVVLVVWAVTCSSYGCALWCTGLRLLRARTSQFLVGCGSHVLRQSLEHFEIITPTLLAPILRLIVAQFVERTTFVPIRC